MRAIRLVPCVIAGLLVSMSAAFGAEWGLKEGTPEIKSAGSLAFGPDGTLYAIGNPGGRSFASSAESVGGFRFPEAQPAHIQRRFQQLTPRRFPTSETGAVRSSDRVHHTQPPELWDLWKTRFSKGWEPARQSPQRGVFLTVRTYRSRFPALSTHTFCGRPEEKGNPRFTFEGLIGGVWLEVQITQTGSATYELKAEGEHAHLSGIVNPVTVGLMIGKNAGSIAVNAEFEH